MFIVSPRTPVVAKYLLEAVYRSIDMLVNLLSFKADYIGMLIALLVTSTLSLAVCRTRVSSRRLISQPSTLDHDAIIYSISSVLAADDVAINRNPKGRSETLHRADGLTQSRH